jgi:hypothetical protein
MYEEIQEQPWQEHIRHHVIWKRAIEQYQACSVHLMPSLILVVLSTNKRRFKKGRTTRFIQPNIFPGQVCLGGCSLVRSFLDGPRNYTSVEINKHEPARDLASIFENSFSCRMRRANLSAMVPCVHFRVCSRAKRFKWAKSVPIPMITMSTLGGLKRTHSSVPDNSDQVPSSQQAAATQHEQRFISRVELLDPKLCSSIF